MVFVPVHLLTRYVSRHLMRQEQDLLNFDPWYRHNEPLLYSRRNWLKLLLPLVRIHLTYTYSIDTHTYIHIYIYIYIHMWKVIWHSFGFEQYWCWQTLSIQIVHVCDISVLNIAKTTSNKYIYIYKLCDSNVTYFDLLKNCDSMLPKSSIFICWAFFLFREHSQVIKMSIVRTLSWNTLNYTLIVRRSHLK